MITYLKCSASVSEQRRKRVGIFSVALLAIVFLFGGAHTASAAPTFQSFSAITASTGADVTVTLPAHQTGDIMLMLGWVRDQNDTVGITTASGWAQVGTGCTSACSASFSRGTTSRYWLFWKRATSASETNPVFNKSGATGDTYAGVIVYSGAYGVGDPFEVVGTAATGTSDPASITGITTLSADSLVTVPVGGEDNNNGSITTTGTDPSAYTEHYVDINTGSDGAITFSEAVRAAAGATGSISVDWNSANPVGWGGVALALKTADVTAPTVTNVSSTKTNGSYTVGEIIPITVTFSETVTVVGTPRIQLETGTTDQQVNYSSGTGSTVLTFNYTVQTGDTSADLDYVATNSLTLNGGTIQDASANNATLTLPTVGGASSIAGQKAIVIDTTADAAPGTPDMTAATDSGSSSTDDITSDTTPDFATSCVTGSTVTLFDNVTLVGSGICAASTVTITSSALSQGTHSAMNAKQTDTVGNVSVASGNLSIVIDTTAPALSPVHIVSNNANTSFAKTGDVVTLTFTSSESVSTPTVTVAGASVSVTGGPTVWSATHTMLGTDTEGVVAFAINFSDVAGNAGIQVTTTTDSSSVTFDRTNPTSTITSPSDGSTTTSTTVALSGTSADTNLSVTTISVDSGSFVATEGTAASWTYSATSLSTGAHTFQTKATDSAGNTGLSSIVHVTVQIVPTLSVTNSPVTYNAAPQSATVVGSVPGVVSNVKYDGSATVPTNAAMYAITADFIPTDTTNYSSLTNASAGNFVISKADQTITFDALSNKTFGDPDFDVSATASSGLTVSFASQTTGVCTVSGATVHLVAVGTCTIRASQAGDSNYNAAANVDRSFSVLPAATKFVIIPPSNSTVGTPVTVTVQAQKSDNSIDTNYQSDVTLNASGSATGDGLVDIVNGVGTLNISDTVAETVNLSLTDSESTGLDVTSTQQLTFAAGSVASFSLNDPGDMYARTRLGYVVTRRDSFGNTVGTGTTTVYLYSSSTSSTKKFYDDSLAGSVITSIDINSGHSTANFWYYDEEPGTYTITASDSTPTADGANGVADASDSVVVSPVATKFVIVPPTNGTVDAPIVITIQAQKPDNSIDTNYQSDVTLTTTGSATGAGLVDIVNGVGTKNISDTVAETVTLGLNDSQSTTLDVSSSHPVTFAGGTIAQFTLSNPAASMAGQRAAYTITRKDQYGNTSSLATSTVYLYSSSTGTNKAFYDAATLGNVVTSIEIPNGQSTADVWYYDELPGTWTVTASDNSPTADGNVGINDAVDSHQVTSGLTAAFSLDNPGDMTAGTRLGYAVTRKDQFNNLVTDGATRVYLYSDSVGTSSPEFYAADTGGSPITFVDIADSQSSVNFWYLDQNPGFWTVTVSDNISAADGANGVADASDSVTVSAAPIVATRFVILQPTDGTVDAPITVTVQAQDGNGNIDTSYQSDVTLNTTGSATGAGLVDIVNGVGTKNISDTTAQNVTLTLSDSQGTTLDTGSTRTVTFAPGVVAQFTLDNPGDVSAGTRIGYIVTRKDQFGNAVTSGATTVYLYSTSTGVNKKFYDAASDGSAITSIVIPNNSSSVGFWYYDEKAGNWFISASDNATAPDNDNIADASDAIAVQPAAVAKFLLDDPGNMTAGTRLGYVVTRKDAFDNLVTTGVTLAYLYSSSTGTTTAFYSAAVGGSPITVATINDGNATSEFWYYDETAGTWLVTVSESSSGANGAVGVQDAVDQVTVSLVPIVATRFVILPVSAVQAGTSATVTIQAEDDAGNVDTTYQNDVTLEATGSATGTGLVDIINGVGTKILTDTVVETVTLSLADTQTTGLRVTSTQSLTFSSTPVSPTAGSGVSGPAVISVPVITGVRLSGRAFPGAKVQILAVSPQGTNIQGQTTASANGSFTALLKDIEEGAGAYGLVAVDALGRTTQTRIFNANYANKNSLLTLDAVLLSPTLGLVHPTVRKGDMVGFVGMASPGYIVSAEIDGAAATTRATAAADGSYKMLLGTGTLALGSHTVRVRQTSPAGLRSEFAPQKVFNVTSLFTPQTDFNQDGVINVQDWSIFLSRWSSTIPSVRALDDLSGDGKVDVADLSIFIRTLKK